jgi:glycosyltransferase involved in cell wall biosynthesis
MAHVYFYTVIDPSGSDNTSGGPQAANSIIRNIEACGYEVEIITPRMEFKRPENSAFNVYHDMFNDPGGSPWFNAEEVRLLKYTETPYLFSECAYTACNTAPYGDLSYGGQDLIPLTGDLMKKAVKFITASPLHGATIESYLGSPLKNLYPYLVEVDAAKFKNLNIDRDIEYITVGAMNPWKGTRVACEKYGKDLTVIGYGDDNLIANGSNFVGKIMNNELPSWYNRSKNFVHLPQWKESFSITTAEAYLCGCNVLVNDNVGAMSFNEDLSDPDTYNNSTEKLQKMIAKEFGHGPNYA